MHPLLRALLSPWEWRLEIVVVLFTLAVLYGVGWSRLRRHSARQRLASWPRLAAYYAGLVILAATLMSPIDRLGGQLFFMHMVQHMLTIMVVAPLLLLANPFPFMVWAPHVAGPRGLPRTVASLFRGQSPFRRALAAATRPLVAWLVFVTVYLGWHDPTLYNAALHHEWIHDLQHITFFLAAMLFWWHVIGAAPRIHGHFSGFARIAYLIGVIPPNMFVGASIAYATSIMYSYYESVPRIWGFTALEDQMLGGAIMWIPGSMMLILAALIILARMFGAKDAPPVQPGGWDGDSVMIMPGLEHRVVQNRWRRLHAADKPTPGQEGSPP